MEGETRTPREMKIEEFAPISDVSLDNVFVFISVFYFFIMVIINMWLPRWNIRVNKISFRLKIIYINFTIIKEN